MPDNTQTKGNYNYPNVQQQNSPFGDNLFAVNDYSNEMNLGNQYASERDEAVDTANTSKAGAMALLNSLDANSSPRTREMVQSYINNLNDISTNLATSGRFNASAKHNLSNAISQYTGNILPMQQKIEAFNKRIEAENEARAKDNTLVSSNPWLETVSYDDILFGNRINTPYYESGNGLRKRVIDAMKNIVSQSGASVQTAKLLGGTTTTKDAEGNIILKNTSGKTVTLREGDSFNTAFLNITLDAIRDGSFFNTPAFLDNLNEPKNALEINKAIDAYKGILRYVDEVRNSSNYNRMNAADRDKLDWSIISGIREGAKHDQKYSEDGNWNVSSSLHRQPTEGNGRGGRGSNDDIDWQYNTNNYYYTNQTKAMSADDFKETIKSAESSFDKNLRGAWGIEGDGWFDKLTRNEIADILNDVLPKDQQISFFNGGFDTRLGYGKKPDGGYGMYYTVQPSEKIITEEFKKTGREKYITTIGGGLIQNPDYEAFAIDYRKKHSQKRFLNDNQIAKIIGSNNPKTALAEAKDDFIESAMLSLQTIEQLYLGLKENNTDVDNTDLGKHLLKQIDALKTALYKNEDFDSESILETLGETYKFTENDAAAQKILQNIGDRQLKWNEAANTFVNTLMDFSMHNPSNEQHSAKFNNSVFDMTNGTSGASIREITGLDNIYKDSSGNYKYRTKGASMNYDEFKKIVGDVAKGDKASIGYNNYTNSFVITDKNTGKSYEVSIDNNSTIPANLKAEIKKMQKTYQNLANLSRAMNTMITDMRRLEEIYKGRDDESLQKQYNFLRNRFIDRLKRLTPISDNNVDIFKNIELIKTADMASLEQQLRANSGSLISQCSELQQKMTSKVEEAFGLFDKGDNGKLNGWISKTQKKPYPTMEIDNN